MSVIRFAINLDSELRDQVRIACAIKKTTTTEIITKRLKEFVEEVRLEEEEKDEKNN